MMYVLFNTLDNGFRWMERDGIDLEQVIHMTEREKISQLTEIPTAVFMIGVGPEKTRRYYLDVGRGYKAIEAVAERLGKTKDDIPTLKVSFREDR